MVDPPQAARELLRALRGRISQVALSRALGYSTNVAADWEAGRRFPTAEEALRVAHVRRIDVPAAFAAFHPPVAAAFDPEHLSAWLAALRGSATNRELAAASGLSEHAVGRFLRGVAQCRLPQFLALVEAVTGRCSDLVAALVPIEQVPSLVDVHRARSRTRRLVYERPWTAAILPQLGVLHHAGFRGDPVGPVARSLGLPEAEVREVVDVLVEAGVAARDGLRVRIVRPLTVDARATAHDRAALRAHWLAVSRDRVLAPQRRDRFAHNVFNVSRADLDRIGDRLQATFREIRAIVAASTQPEVTAVYLSHLYPLPVGGDDDDA
ncbi:MAG: DUF4423 domain-containing protein [Myxococcota bacterium]